MRARRRGLVILASAAALSAAMIAQAVAQTTKYTPPGTSSGADATRQYIPRTPSHRPNTPKPPRNRFRDFDAAIPGILLTLPHAVPGPRATPPPGGGRFIDDGTVVEDVDRRKRRTQRRTTRRGSSGVPPAGETRLVPDEVVIELPANVSPQAVDALEQRHNLTRIASTTSQLTGTTVFHWRIPDQRSVPAVIRALEADAAVNYAQPNYIYALPQHGEAKHAGDAAQYALAKMRLPRAHHVTRGDGVLVAVIDSGIDAAHPDLSGAVVDSFNALASPDTPHEHGTAIAGLIAARGRLLGVAPGARILAARAFNPEGDRAEGTTFDVLKALDWAAAKGAQVINMSFAGPSDPAINRSLDAAHKRNIVLIAAAGNEGPKAPPLYPAAHPNVIAVTATDPDDKLFKASNRGRHIGVAAPGVDILAPVPDGGYKLLSGTSMSCAEVSGVAALLLADKPDLRPDALRKILLATAKDLGPKGHDNLYGAGLADAYRAVGGTRQERPVASGVRLPAPRLTSGNR